MKYLKDIEDWQGLKNEVVCGDCLEGMKLLPDKSIDLVLTDPPYGLGGRITNGGGWAKKRGLPKGGYDWDQKVPSRGRFEEMFRISEEQIIWGGNYFIEFLKSSRCWLIWDKAVKFTAITNELAWTSLDKKPAIFKMMLQQDDSTYGKRHHPTQKPVELMRWILENYSKEGDLICDPFMGSWTTARACKDLGRDFIGFELSEKYCKVGEERLRQEVMF